MTDANQEVIHREFYNRSRDILRVYNPLDTDFKFKFDSVWYKVPAKQTKDIERYLAGKYFHDISEFIIGKLIYEKGEKMLSDRREKGLAEFMNKYDENRAIWDSVPRMDNKELLTEIANQVILGVVEMFASEPAPEEIRPQRIRQDIPLTDEILSSVAKGKLRNIPVSKESVDLEKEKAKLKPAFKKDLKDEVSVE